MPMQDKQNLVTLAFVLIIGLLGGYMIAQHVGHAADSHRETHDIREHDSSDAHHAVPPQEIQSPDGEGSTQGGAQIQVQ
jgi:hypothetical protein